MAGRRAGQVWPFAVRQTRFTVSPKYGPARHRPARRRAGQLAGVAGAARRGRRDGQHGSVACRARRPHRGRVRL